MAWAAVAAALAACAGCHPGATADFAGTAMARAASTPGFVAEWGRAGRDPACLRCHAPAGGPGVGCAACHGEGHPGAQADPVRACARCHDAPGENTLRSYAASRAARAGRTCIDCHAPRGRPHALRGPATGALLPGSVDLTGLWRGDEVELVLAARAGHAVPGGTSGRALWLVAEARDGAGRVVAEARWRFGWEYADGGWVDRTLWPDRPARRRFAVPPQAVAVAARVLYRLAPSPEPEGPDAVLVARRRWRRPAVGRRGADTMNDPDRRGGWHGTVVPGGGRSHHGRVAERPLPAGGGRLRLVP
ncbi:hypothetical protein [Inmirania thermothiophila]|uniref:Uncharacterized protein n=1 Tax=Inmirania thermothiophila TaxID=1750597 RepID=A0A3N1XZF5_9GAMM|nr:hypothetical protein [Inmirania thermothiophila]ROR31973.1 hypothetical protein EDC57_1155 [Inmirania thermothiophila]